jgi:hypothetical protein
MGVVEEKERHLCDLPMKVLFQVFFHPFRFQSPQRLVLVLDIKQQGIGDGNLTRSENGSYFLVAIVFAAVRATCRVRRSAEIVYTTDFGVFADVDVNRKRRTSKCESTFPSSASFFVANRKEEKTKIEHYFLYMTFTT